MPPEHEAERLVERHAGVVGQGDDGHDGAVALRVHDLEHAAAERPTDARALMADAHVDADLGRPVVGAAQLPGRGVGDARDEAGTIVGHEEGVALVEDVPGGFPVVLGLGPDRGS